MAKPTFLFDLDQTLLDTSELEADRRRRRWDKVKAKLDQVKPFRKRGLFPHELPDKLKTNGHPVAIVTSSPRWYAQPLLKQFQIPYDLLVAYDDTSQHKPDPAPLLLALEKLGCPPEQAYYVGDATTDVQASFRAGVKSIGAGWQSKDWPLVGMDQLADAPDIMLYEPTLLLKEPLLQSSQYFAELVTSDIEPNRHFGSMLVWKSQATEFMALGRYFKTADIRHGTHRFTRKIIELKRSDSAAELFARALAPIITAIGLRTNYKPVTITCVPPKPEQRNRFAAIFDHLRSLCPASIVFAPDGLRVTKTISGYKQMGRAARARAAADTFGSNQSWQGTVVLIDDVYTTGATLKTCMQVLAQKGAQRVIPVALAYTQHAYQEKICPSCDRPMRIRTNRRRGNEFWGCTGYPDHCKHTINIPVERRASDYLVERQNLIESIF